MTKFLAVLKREYIQRVRSRMFIVTTVLLPLTMSLFGVVPILVFKIEVGEPLRIAVIDETGKLYGRFKDNLTKEEIDLDNVRDSQALEGAVLETEAGEKQGPQQVEFSQAKFNVEEVKSDRTREELRAQLDKRIEEKSLDAYLIIPADIMRTKKARLIRANTSDLFSTRRIQKAVGSSVREQRLIDAKVDAQTMADLDSVIELQTTRMSRSGGGEQDEGGGFALVFAVGFVMYLSVLLYGQVVLGAVIEEKETRIVEVLFSTIKPYTLLMGKLLGVSLVALTQLAIWGLAFLAFSLYGINVLASRGIPAHLPNIPLVFYLYFALFFLLGYFVYATLYALVGSIVTTPQEGGQLAVPIVLLLVIGFYFFLPVSRSPDSSFAFWISLVPFFAPVTMLVRIVTQTPPFWQIALSLGIGFSTTAILMWIAARIYRMGMLMYGKRPTIPEIVRWVRQS